MMGVRSQQLGLVHATTVKNKEIACHTAVGKSMLSGHACKHLFPACVASPPSSSFIRQKSLVNSELLSSSCQLWPRGPNHDSWLAIAHPTGFNANRVAASHLPRLHSLLWHTAPPRGKSKGLAARSREQTKIDARLARTQPHRDPDGNR